ncbi:MAG: protein kinase [Polyangiales bacterium]
MSFGTGELIGGRYRLEELIGSGGMGEVFRAHDVLLERAVALKLVDVGDPRKRKEITKSFLREARISAAIQHRNVVQMLDFGTHDERIPYIVMELLEGESLADVLSRGEPLSFAWIFSLIEQVLDGLAAAHDAGVVHRDLKPENIYLAQTRDGVCPKILDFGISRLLDTKAGSASITTTTGHVVGTPAYMSPEQARGVKFIDLRTDVYSIAVVLYELLSGELPFSSENPGDLMVMIVTREAPELTWVMPGIPHALSDVVERALHKTPAERFEDARALQHALRVAGAELLESTAQGTLETRARPEPWRQKSRAEPTLETSSEQPRPKRRLPTWLGRRALFTAAALVVVGSVLGISAALLGRSSAAPRYIVVQADQPRVAAPGEPVAQPLAERVAQKSAGKARSESDPASRLAGSFKRQKQGVVSCVNAHADEAKRTPKLSVRIALEASGKVREAHVLPEGVAEGALGACIAASVRAMKFPRQAEPIGFEVPLTAR